MKQGFTLIELLAVIVILAIIATIAVPIVLNIINDSKESSNERSLDMYKKAVENAVASYRLNFPEDNNIKLYKLYKKYNGKKDFIEYSGSEIDCDVYIYSTGNVYITNCKIEGKEILTSDSTEENKKYYSVGEDTIEAHIGEEVNYITYDSSNAFFTVSNVQYKRKWRILGVENGKVLLISDPIASTKFAGINGYHTAIDQLNQICINHVDTYGQNVKNITESVRSVTVGDINKLTGYNPSKDSRGEISHQGEAKEYGNTITYSYNNGIYYTSTNGVSGTENGYSTFTDINGATISSSSPNTVLTYTNNYYFYDYRILTRVKSGETLDEKSFIIKKDTALYDLIGVLPNTNILYWLADQVICANASRASWQIRYMNDRKINTATLYHSQEGEKTTSIYSVRAVVTLSADAKLVYDEQTSMWNIE